MRRVLLPAAACAALLLAFQAARWVAGRQTDGSFLLPTGQTITPLGRHLEIADRPLGMCLSPDGKLLAVVCGSNFQPRALQIVDLAAWKTVQSISLGDSFVGIVFSPDGRHLYAGGGNTNQVLSFRRSAASGEFEKQGSIPTPGGAPSGLALSPDGKSLWVALNQKHAVARIDLATGQLREFPAGTYPYTVAIANGKVYVSNWGGRRPQPADTTDGMHPVIVDPRTGIPSTGSVSVYSLQTQASLGEITVGLHPSGMVVSPDGTRLYVANANSDTVSVVNTSTDKLERTLEVPLFRKAPLGSAPNALAFDRNGRTLFVANAANNAVAVVDTHKQADYVSGFLPTGWYPTAVRLTPDNSSLIVASGYGFGSVAPAKDPSGARSYRDRAGVISLIPMEEVKRLSAHTKAALRNNAAPGYKARQSPAAGHPVPMNPGDRSPIRHVIYIIKENRTYDQIFGDLPQGNGDPRLAVFGREVTPNHHALAEQFVLLDNFYAPGDQSALGHRWCTQGYASDWVHKYGNGRNDQNPMLFAPTEFLWDNAGRHGVSVRAFGERGLNTIDPPNATWTDLYNDWKDGVRRVRVSPRAVILGLRKYYSPNYPAYGLVVPDQYRVERFLEEFREFEKQGNHPRLMVVLLPQDHTSGTAPGFPTPRAMIADNDRALGRLVEAVSNSSIWKNTAIFVVEDDAQSGVDHVDGHRTVALVVSPWVRRKAVDNTFYTTINMYRTIEQILGLPPSNQFDLAADPMFSVFTASPDFTAYSALPNRIPLDEMNPPVAALRGEARRHAIASMRMDLSEPDAAPPELLDRIIMRSAR